MSTHHAIERRLRRDASSAVSVPDGLEARIHAGLRAARIPRVTRPTPEPRSLRWPRFTLARFALAAAVLLGVLWWSQGSESSSSLATDEVRVAQGNPTSAAVPFWRRATSTFDFERSPGALDRALDRTLEREVQGLIHDSRQWTAMVVERLPVPSLNRFRGE